MAALWWAAGEEIEFPNKGSSVVTSTTSSIRRTAWTRAALASLNSAGLAALAAESPPLPTPLTSLWMSVEWVPGGTASNRAEVGLARSGVGGGIYLGRVSDQATLMKVTSANVLTVLVTIPGAALANAILHRIDMAVTGFGTATANVKVYLETNATAHIDWTGDLSGLGFTDLDVFRALGNGTAGNSVISEVILADEDTRTFGGVATLAPSGAGTTNTFTSGSVVDIDEAVLSDADMLQSATVGQEFDCALTDITTPGNWTVRGVKVCARAAKGATGPGTLQLGINSGGTRNTVDKPLLTALQSYERLMETNPITGQRFTTAEVNALEACLKSAT